MDPGLLTVLIVDDHPVFADALALAIDTAADVSCAGTAGDIDHALEVAERAPPDVVVMDLDLGSEDGITGARKLLERRPASQVLVLTGQRVDRSLALAALEAGAAGLLPKGTRLSVVVEAIRSLRPGTFIVDRQLLASLLKANTVIEAPLPRHRGGVLTTREQQVLELLANGVDAKAAAARLHIRVNTCRGYIKTLLSKLDAHSQLEAVAIARAKGLLNGNG